MNFMDILIKLGLSLLIGTFLFLLVVAANAFVGLVTAIRVLRKAKGFTDQQCEELTKIMEEANGKPMIFHGFWVWWKTRKYL